MLKKLKSEARYFLDKLKAGERILNDKYFISTKEINKKEVAKQPERSEIINFLLQQTKALNYLEIGVRNPSDNFDKINCENKFSVDPGVEFKQNPVDFKLTSDDFFEKLNQNKLEQLKNDIKFDVIFVDGLHLSEQVERDIINSLQFISDSGFIVLHDCNPPTEFHQRENYYFRNSPARGFWNGTTWKAFYKFRHHKDLFSICFDTDWGVGVLSKKQLPLFNRIENDIENQFYEYNLMDSRRKEFLNLTDYKKWIELVIK
ncbi:class I SAM-dependent methyltransferase [Flavobacterium sp.]|uniref:class I SAM-dependent methyltransferase n=1 Tax=Flavobacterium sp. TaxID=239 RepID=UPI002638C1EC|nr:class I SAM-dependent methyltransferase [Flavobacterium sp.]